MWRKASQALNMTQSNKKYVSSLKKSPLFPNASFYQIELDYPRLQFPSFKEREIKHLRLNDMGRDLFTTYAKRNAVN